MPPSTSIQEFQKVLKTSKNIVVVAGAGLSSASGIPTFRGAGGLWRNLDATKLATPEAFHDNPSLVWQFYQYRREVVLKSQPNNAHRVLAAMSVPKLLRQVAPAANSFHFITQNIDGLSTRASSDLNEKLKSAPAGTTVPLSTETSPPVITSTTEMHGRLFDLKCTKCNWSELDYSNPLCPALGRPIKMSDLQDALVRDEDTIPENELPRCRNPACGELARPGVVWFGEAIPGLEELYDLVEAADLCIVVGTSSTVYPAASFAYMVKENGGTVAVFNLEEADGSDEADFLFLGGCEETLGKAVGVPEEWKEYGVQV